MSRNPSILRAPQTAGLARSQRGRKHRFYFAEALAEQKRVRELLFQSRALLKHKMQAG